jgi:hypothetical protein
MWACFKACVAEHLGKIGIAATIGVVVALIAIFSGVVVAEVGSGGTATVVFAAVVAAVGPYVAAGAAGGIAGVVGGLIGCIMHCL